MTTYHFNRGGSRAGSDYHLFNFSLPLVKFFFYSLLFFFLDIVNIPVFFGGKYNLFLFEAGIFYLLFIKKHKKYFFVIALFYGIYDIIQLNYIGVSFMSSFISILAINSIIKHKVKKVTLFESITLFAFYLLIFISSKTIITYSIFDLNFSLEFFIFLTKSFIYTTLLFTNVLVFLKNIFN